MLNLSLLGPKQVITAMYDCVKSFKCKLSLWQKKLASGNLAHFKMLQSVCYSRVFQTFDGLEPLKRSNLDCGAHKNYIGITLTLINCYLMARMHALFGT